MTVKLIVILDDDMDQDDARMIALDLEDIDGVAEVEGMGFPLGE